MLAAPHAHRVHDKRVGVVRRNLRDHVLVALKAVGESAHHQNVLVIGGVLLDHVEELERRTS